MAGRSGSRSRGARVVVVVGALTVSTAALVISASAVRAGSASSPAKAPSPLGTVWALNATSIVAYPAGSAGNVAPIATISGSRVGLETGSDLAVTTTGALWVTDAASDAIKEFAPGANGNIAPEAAIAGPKTRLHSPGGIALARNGNLWILNDDPSDGSASLSEFAAGAHGNVAPIERIAGPKTRLFPGYGVAVSKSGSHLWVAHVEGGSGLDSPALQEFATAASGNVAAVRTIAGPHTQLDFPYGVAIDRSGDLVVSDDPDSGSVSAILTFAATASGDAKPIRAVSGSITDVDQPSYLGFDAFGDLWEPNHAGDSLARFAGTASGDLAPKQFIAGDKADLHRPNAVAVYATPPGVPRGLTISSRPHRHLTITWRAPLDNGGGIIGYRLLTRVSRHGRWSIVTRTNQRSFTTGKLAKHHRDYFVVSAFNADGSSPRTAPLSRLIR